MSLEKLTIFYKYQTGNAISLSSPASTSNGDLVALFNPSQLTYSKTVHWRTVNTVNDNEGSASTTTQSWGTKYKSTAPETLSISLFFDVYEEYAWWVAKSLFWLLPKPSVFDYTKKLAEIARCDEELHYPPTCILRWGKVKVFTGVITSLKQTYTMFAEDGTPLRATADCSFREVAMDSDKIRYELNSPDVDKTYVVRPGDTLELIAAALYDDRKHWRVIAEANRIDNPRRLTPGQVLHIPKLR